MNQEDFVSYDQALRLKNLGFDWECIAKYGAEPDGKPILFGLIKWWDKGAYDLCPYIRYEHGQDALHYIRRQSDNAIIEYPCMHDADETDFDDGYILPKYEIGEVVAIAQSYKDAGLGPKTILELPIKGSKTKGVMQCMAQFASGWNNKMFVKAEYMPHHIRITNIRVERLQDISDEDCIKELGLKHVEVSMGFKKYQTHMVYQFLWEDKLGRTKEYSHESPKEVFAVMIDKICGNGTWNDNPFVFVYEFELVD